jgi:lactobin A/cerein 7B family class IIb bacteriocin
MDIMRELTDAELESVTGGLGVAAAATGANLAAAGSAINSVDFQAVIPFGGSVTVLISTAVAGAFGV